MAFRHGSKAAVTVDGTNLSAYCDSVELSIDVDTAETSAFGATWKTSVAGLAGAQLELSGNYDPTASTGPVAVLTGLIGQDAFPVEYFPGGNVSGQVKHAFNALLTSYAESSPVGDKVTFSASLIVDGAVTTTTV
jgi:hypothetical protein